MKRMNVFTKLMMIASLFIPGMIITSYLSYSPLYNLLVIPSLIFMCLWVGLIIKKVRETTDKITIRIVYIEETERTLILTVLNLVYIFTFYIYQLSIYFYLMLLILFIISWYFDFYIYSTVLSAMKYKIYKIDYKNDSWTTTKVKYLVAKEDLQVLNNEKIEITSLDTNLVIKV